MISGGMIWIVGVSRDPMKGNVVFIMQQNNILTKFVDKLDMFDIGFTFLIDRMNNILVVNHEVQLVREVSLCRNPS